MSKQASLFTFFNKSNTPTMIKTESAKTVQIKGVEVSELTLVWGKLDGHPWWPGLVCKPPSGDPFVRRRCVHLQFFEDPPSRGWVRENFIKPYGDPMKVGIKICKNSAWLTARALADEAAKKSMEQRRALLVDHELSDVEMDGSDMGSDEEEQEGNSSKENMDDSNTSSAPPTPAAGKRRVNNSSDSAEHTSKRRRIVLKSESEESGDEYKPGKDEEASSDSSSSSGEDEIDLSKDEPPPSEDEPTPSPSPVKKLKHPGKKPMMNGRNTPATPYTPTAPHFSPYTPTAPSFTPTGASPAVKSKLALFAAKESTTDEADTDAASGAALKLPFLLPESIRDGAGRRPDHPEYDPRTLTVPDSFLNQQTPGHRQWWNFKAQHYDTVLFFKMGKFYELFYMDAEIAVQELGLLLMKGSVPHAGFPEISYGRFSASLIEKGYKVARIEQTETPEMMEKRCKAASRCSKFDRVVRREVCQLSSAGTRVWGDLDADPTAPNPAYLLAITSQDGSSTVSSRVGVSFIDTSLGEFHLGQFTDDRHYSRLRTLLALHPPAQILTKRGSIPAAVRSILSNCGVSPRLHESLVPETEFWTAEKTLQFLSSDGCFEREGSVEWPDVLRGIMQEGGVSSVEGSSDLSISCLGALVWYLQRCYLHTQLLTRRLFHIYVPPDNYVEEGTKKITFKQKHMVIDGGSVVTLELLRNSSTGQTDGSLLAVLDHTSTPMGKRLLQQWVCAPLLSASSINHRLDAVEELRRDSRRSGEVAALLTNLPDIDRLLPRIHSQGLKFSPSDPNSRAIVFEGQQYSRRRVQCFLTTVDAFKTVAKLPDVFADSPPKSHLLRSLVLLGEDGGNLPDMKDTLTFFEKAFNHELAKKEGKIIPSSGVDNQYDKALETISQTKEELDTYLKEQCKFFSAKVVYFGSDRRRYQLEVPEGAARLASEQHELVSQRKGYKRFSTARTKELLAQMSAAEEAREIALKDIARRIFEQFDDKQDLWSGAVHCVSTLDVLLSLSRYADSTPTVRPEICSLSENEEAFLEIRDGVHPCIGLGVDDIIPNDVVLGSGGGEGAHSPLVIVTGPNMGGKSTLMRQTALLTVMAQMGCPVPCSSMRLSPVDRIFTRVGASDRLLAGESTFLLELRETAAILQHATSHALVLLDELGRGTATHDGTAVAWAVAGALVRRRCRTLFSTHYHGLVQHFAHTPGVSLGHMACMVEGGDPDDDNNSDAGEESITFLYKFSPGVCPKSYGFNAARLAELPSTVVQQGRAAARRLEARTDAVTAFKKLMTTGGSADEKRNVIKGLAKVLKAIGASAS